MHLGEATEIIPVGGGKIEPANLAGQPASFRQDGSLLCLYDPPVPFQGQVLSPLPASLDSEINGH